MIMVFFETLALFPMYFVCVRRFSETHMIKGRCHILILHLSFLLLIRPSVIMIFSVAPLVYLIFLGTLSVICLYPSIESSLCDFLSTQQCHGQYSHLQKPRILYRTALLSMILSHCGMSIEKLLNVTKQINTKNKCNYYLSLSFI